MSEDYPTPGQWDTSEARPEPSRRMAWWALVLALAPCLVTWVAAVVLAIIVLASGPRSGRSGKPIAVAAIVVSVLWVAGLMLWGVWLAVTSGVDRDGDGRITNAGEISAEDVRVGDCLNLPDGDTIHSVDAVPCADEHEAEVYAVWELGGDEFPGSGKVERAAEAGCLQRFAGFVGKRYARSELEIFSLRPTRASWNLDDREVSCWATVPAGETVTGTLEGSRR